MPRDLPLTGATGQVAQVPEETVYYCAQCGAEVTRARWEQAVEGGHEHTVFNPAGQVFRIVCFQEAPGVQAVGPASRHFTWFRGFVWRIGVCRACAAHLGWRYEAEGKPFFFGLIRSTLSTRRT